MATPVLGTLQIANLAAAGRFAGSDASGNLTWHNSTGAVNVMDPAYGATGNGSTDDTSAISAALATGLPVYFPSGTYLISSAISPVTGQILFGDGPQHTTIHQSSTSAHGIYWTDQYAVCIRDMKISGPTTGTGDGIHVDKTTQVPVNCLFQNLQIYHFGEYGVFMNTPVTTTFQTVETQNSGSYGWYIENGTSTTFIGCYSNADNARGFNLNSMTYSAFHGCAADNTIGGYGYVLSACSAIAMNGCGAESQTTTGTYEIIGGNSITLNSCESFANPGIALNINSSALNVTVVGFYERSPSGGATNSIKVTSGSSVTVINPTITTATSYAAGTVTSIQNGIIQPAVQNTVLTDASTVAVNAALCGISGNFRLTLTASGHTIGAPTNPVDGQSVIFEIVQPASGGPYTVTWATGTGAYEFSTGLPTPTLSIAANARDYVGFVYNATANIWSCVAYQLGF